MKLSMIAAVLVTYTLLATIWLCYGALRHAESYSPF